MKLLGSFSNNLNSDVEKFLTSSTKAIRFEQTNNARTYLILNDNGEILAYFSLSFKVNLECYAVLSEAKALIGGRIIILECENNKNLIQLYERHGFTLIETENNCPYSLRTLYIHIIEE
ncbi:hypothetical protein CRN77_04095 [Proteus vulgaris]|nr:hypothetical protein CRN77_04095 [Proteus vulgaris]